MPTVESIRVLLDETMLIKSSVHLKLSVVDDTFNSKNLVVFWGMVTDETTSGITLPKAFGSASFAVILVSSSLHDVKTNMRLNKCINTLKRFIG